MAVDAKRAKEIFLAASEGPTADREPFLDRECAGDNELRQRVEALLNANDAPGVFLNRPTPSGTIPPRPSSKSHGLTIGQIFAGKYKLREELGEGGMGVVFVADQIEPVQRRVALKVIRGGADSAHVLARFEQERQALALMDHPNIAKVFDAGVSDSGMPYFVMELIKGVPLTRFCDEAKLTPRERLELFIPVCQAVQHAHQKGVIHRDLKPMNILVGLYDGLPVPKVIDFGVAKATGPRISEHSVYTEIGSVIGTLEYMSPEQAELNNLDIDTRSDVYALGVILYELLTGSVPFSRRVLEEGGLAEMLRMIKEDEPPRPSTRISASQELPSVAAVRKTEPAKLSRLICGDLDWITMKALEKDRSRRYETANGMAMDIQRYLADEPVLAGRPSIIYRFRKFVRRNKSAVVAGTFIALCLVVGIAATSTALTWAVRERDAKEQARQEAAENAARAIAERDAKARALAAEIVSRKAEQSLRARALAVLRDVTDDTVSNQLARDAGLTDDSRDFLKTLIKHYEGLSSIATNDEESRSIRAEGYFRIGLMRAELGETRDALAAYRQAISILKNLVAEAPTNGEFQDELAKCHINLGNVLNALGQTDDAKAAFEFAIEKLSTLLKVSPQSAEYRQDLARAHQNLGRLLQTLGRSQLAEFELLKAHAIRRELADEFPKHRIYRLDLMKSYESLGGMFQTAGRLNDAEERYVEAIKIGKNLIEKSPRSVEYRSVLAGIQMGYAVLVRSLGRIKDSETTYSEALVNIRQLVADLPGRPDFRSRLAVALNNQANLLRSTGRFEEADKSFQEAIALQRRLIVEQPTGFASRQNLARSLANRAILLRAMNRMAEAEAAYSESLVIRRELVAAAPKQPEFREELASNLNSIFQIYWDLGRHEQAASANAEALAIRKQLVAEYPARTDYRSQLAGSYVSRGIQFSNLDQLSEAEIAHEEGLRLFKQLVLDVPGRPQYRNLVAGSLVNLAQIDVRRRNFASALRRLDEAVPFHEAALKSNPSNPKYREFRRTSLHCRAEASAGMMDQASAFEAAKALRDLGWNPPVDAYYASWAMCACLEIIRSDKTLDAEKRKHYESAYSDQAIAFLKDAALRGYVDVAVIQRNKLFEPLYERDDYKKVIAAMSAKPM